MRHYKKGRKLGTDASHTKAIKKNLVVNIFTNDRIKTTLERAKEIRADIDRVITWAKRGDVHSRRLAIAKLGNKELVAEIFSKVEQGMFKDRPGGYSRILRLGTRRGDTATIVIMELVLEPVVKKAAVADDKKPAKKAATKKAAAKEEAAEKTESDAAEDAPADAEDTSTAEDAAADDDTPTEEDAAADDDTPAEEEIPLPGRGAPAGGGEGLSQPEDDAPADGESEPEPEATPESETEAAAEPEVEPEVTPEPEDAPAPEAEPEAAPEDEVVAEEK